MRRIALLNIQRCNSHGAVLLAYALEKVLEKNEGFQIVTLNYKYAGRIIEKNILRRILKKAEIILNKKLYLGLMNEKMLNGLSVKKEYDKQASHFKAFRKERLHLSKEITDVNDDILKMFDTFIVGSDVVWKPEIVRCEDREIYFLKSVPQDALKIAFAASVGTDDAEVLEKYKDEYRGAFDSFDYISIREQSMISFVKQYTDCEVISVIDPVFLLTPEDYQKIEVNDPHGMKGKGYVYVYLLGENREAVKRANEIAKSTGLSVLVDLNDAFDNVRMFEVEAVSAISAGPAEFLYNIRNASYVITDSFHATAFSLIFNRELWVFNRGNISVRMRDLLDRFEISERMYNGKLARSVIDWEQINKRIARERELGLKYLLNALREDQEDMENG